MIVVVFISSVCLTLWGNSGVLGDTTLTDISSQVFGANSNGVISAFSDFTADKLVDVFTVVESEKGPEIYIYNASQSSIYSSHSVVGPLNKDVNITSVMTADFNGDSIMDMLITTCPKSGEPKPGSVTLTVYWGHTGVSLLTGPMELDVKFKDQPLIFDFNADMLPDLLGEKETGERIVLLSSVFMNFTEIPFPSQPVETQSHPMAFPQSSAYFDFNGDYSPDLIVTTEAGYEIWLSEEGNLQYNGTIPFPLEGFNSESAKLITIADIDKDGHTDIVVPTCGDDCSDSAIYVYHNERWTMMTSNFKYEDQNWNFVSKPELTGIYPQVHLGDYNADGYPDGIVILQSTKDKNIKKAVLLMNVPCPEDQACNLLGRTFVPDPSYTPLSSVGHPVMAAFFDIYENGILDVLLVAMTSKGNEGKEYYPTLRAYQQTSTTDSCFLKVTVTTGLCEQNCPEPGRMPYGVIQRGASVKYETTSVDGYKLYASGSQQPQSAHYSLQLPYVMFGLDMMPNFVDKVTVGIPSSEHVNRSHTWTMVIPNSQLIVIPYPTDQPSRWMMKMFVTPSRLVLLTGAALLGTCGFVAGIVGILHWREKREDMAEKRQESHKFHFDAM